MRTTALLAMAATASAISLQPMESGGPGPDLERLGRVTGATHLRNVDTRTGRARARCDAGRLHAPRWTPLAPAALTDTHMPQ